MRDIKTRAEAETQTYGGFNKHPYNPSKCVESVRDEGSWPSFHQCERKPGFGPEGIYCKLHDPASVEARRKKQSEKWDAKQKSERPIWYANAMAVLLRESQISIEGDWRKRRDDIINKLDA